MHFELWHYCIKATNIDITYFIWFTIAIDVNKKIR